MKYAVSRTTVRQALAELEQRGLIYRIQGKGSFIASEASVDEPSSMLDFDMLAQCESVEPGEIVRELVCRDLPDVAMSTVQMFGGASRASVCRTDVRYLIDGSVVALESIYLRRSDVNALPDCESEPVLRTLMAIRLVCLPFAKAITHGRLQRVSEMPLASKTGSCYRLLDICPTRTARSWPLWSVES